MAISLEKASSARLAEINARHELHLRLSYDESDYGDVYGSLCLFIMQIFSRYLLERFSENSFRFRGFLMARLMKFDWHFRLRLFGKWISLALVLWLFSLNNDFPFAFDCSKKKLIQQRSQQTSDRPSIPNILMMPITKPAEKSEQYAAEWVPYWLFVDWLSDVEWGKVCETFIESKLLWSLF